MTATNHDDQLGEIYPTMLNELNCKFGVSFTRLHCCGRHGMGLYISHRRNVRLHRVTQKVSLQFFVRNA